MDILTWLLSVSFLAILFVSHNYCLKVLKYKHELDMAAVGYEQVLLWPHENADVVVVWQKVKRDENA